MRASNIHPPNLSQSEQKKRLSINLCVMRNLLLIAKICVKSPLGGGLIASLVMSPYAVAQQVDQASGPGPHDAATGEVATVVVQGKSAAVSDRIDKRIYSLRDDPDAQTGLAADVLGKIPSVQVSPTGVITLRGDAHVHVTVDGKEPANGNLIIETLAAADIERIEIITNPSAQYAPDGTSGIINIVTRHRHVLGFGGNVSARADTRGQILLAPSASFLNGPLTIDGRLSLKHAPSNGESSSNIFIPAPIQQSSRYHGESDSYLASINFSYKVNNLSSITFSASDYQAFSSNTTVGSYESLAADYFRSVLGSRDIQEADAEANYTYSNGNSGTEASIDMTHTVNKTAYPITETDSYPNGELAIYGNHDLIKGPDDEIKGGYEKHFSGGQILTAGVDWLHHNQDNQESFFDRGSLPGPTVNGTEDFFSIVQSISSAFVTYQASFGKWSVLPGVRVEQEQHGIRSGASTASVTALNWFPSLHLQYDLGDRSKLKLSYSRRVQRPDLAAYDPAPSQISASGETVGNPYLRPTTTDSIEAEYNYSHGDRSYEAALFFKQNHDLISPVTTSMSDGFLITSPENAGETSSEGVEITLRGPIWPKNQKNGGLDCSANLNLSDNEVDRLGVGNRDYFGLNGNTILRFKSQKGDEYEVNFTFGGRNYSVEGYTEGVYRIDLSYQHQLNERISFSASIVDLTNSQALVTIINAPMLNSRIYNRPFDRALRAGLSWKFGKASKE